uniref:Testis development related protein n=1 Tax=Rousettus aegyptiacus TaxID=9407 RepID=A0A7J8E014_ROUAE|nr:testis development related protein [Rousettus aegyptiacus]
MGTGGPEPRCPVLAARPGVQGASFRGWKEVASLFNSEDEQHLLGAPESPRSRGTHLRPREEPKAEKKSGFWEHLALKHNAPPKKPDEIEGWEPPKFALGDEAAEVKGRQKAQSHCRKQPPAQDRDPWGTRPHKLDRENTAIQGEEAAKHFALNT